MSLLLALAPFWAWSFEWALLLWLFMLGAVVGSFLNVVVYRLPRGMSVVSPASRCPACGSPIAPRDNLPIVGWLLIAGRCRACGQRVSPRYPTVELLTAVLFVVLAWYGPMRVQGSGFRAQGFHDGYWASPALGQCMPLSSKELWGAYAYHVCLTCSLIAAGLIEFDGQRCSGRLVVPTLAIGFFAPLVWPHLRPLHSGLMDGATHIVRLVTLADGAAGLAVGLALGWAASAVVSRARRATTSLVAAPHGHFPWTLAWVGVFLGIQATSALAVAAMSTWLCTSLVGHLMFRLRRIGPVLCLIPWTLAWMLGWKLMVVHASWFAPVANARILPAAGATVVALAWIIGKLLPAQPAILLAESTGQEEMPTP